MSLAPCSLAVRDADDEVATELTLHERIEVLERCLGDTVRRLRRAEAEIALLNDRLAWAEADLAAAGEARRPLASRFCPPTGRAGA